MPERTLTQLSSLDNPGKRVLFLGYDDQQTRLIDALIQAGCEVSHTAAPLSAVSHDLIVSFGYRHIISAELLGDISCPAINLHTSYLPYNRGAHPNFWSAFDNTPSGVTIHVMDAGIDTGPVIAQRYVNFDRGETTFIQSQARLMQELENLFIEILDDLLNDNWTAIPQRGEGSIHFMKDLPEQFSGWDADMNTEIARLVMSGATSNARTPYQANNTKSAKRSLSLRINDRELSADYPPYIIAEVSANHNGSIQRARDTILAAKHAGVDAVKIQTYTPDTMTIESDNDDFWIKEGLWKGRSLYDLYGDAYTPYEWHKELFDYARELDITLFSSPFDETAVDLLQTLGAPAYKVASFELVDLPLIGYIAKQGKPMLMSTGMANMNEITEAIDTARSNGCNDIAIFHCISSYPTPLEQANLQSIIALQEAFDVQVGLSDHTLGNTASIAATTLGASLIEKHFTLDRGAGGVDSAFSLEPHEMKALIDECTGAWHATRAVNLERPSIENVNLIFRRSLYFVEDLSSGETICAHHVRRIRPGFGLAPKHYHRLIGSTITRDVKKGDRVLIDDVDQS